MIIVKRKFVFGVFILLSSLYASTVLADEPCNVTVCLWGKMNGASSTECNSQEKRFFNIVKKKRGAFLPGKTFDARKDFLNKECPASYGASEFVERVVKKYGKVKL
jgi:hypothetical protein